MFKELKNSPLKYEELSDSELELVSGGYPGEDTKNPNDDPPGQQDVGNRPKKIDIKQWQKFK
jgi:bacteriocin-like protein